MVKGTSAPCPGLEHLNIETYAYDLPRQKKTTDIYKHHVEEFPIFIATKTSTTTCHNNAVNDENIHRLSARIDV